jgi:8-oxo-dGTP diphosphatase
MEPVTPTSRHLTASLAVVDPSAGKLLLIYHKASGKWIFPGGHVDPDESPAEAAVREVREETGVYVDRLIGGTPARLVPGAQPLTVPWVMAEHRAPAKPERPGKPAEPPHSHLDMLYLASGTAPTR